MRIFPSLLPLVAFFAASAASTQSIASDEIVLRIATSKPELHELLEPLRMSCARSSVSIGRSHEQALAEIDECLVKRFLSAVELERSIRVLYPADLTPERLQQCIGEVDEDKPLLPCIQKKVLR